MTSDVVIGFASGLGLAAIAAVAVYLFETRPARRDIRNRIAAAK